MTQAVYLADRCILSDCTEAQRRISVMLRILSPRWSCEISVMVYVEVEFFFLVRFASPIGFIVWKIRCIEVYVCRNFFLRAKRVDGWEISDFSPRYTVIFRNFVSTKVFAFQNYTNSFPFSPCCKWHCFFFNRLENTCIFFSSSNTWPYRCTIFELRSRTYLSSEISILHNTPKRLDKSFHRKNHHLNPLKGCHASIILPRKFS